MASRSPGEWDGSYDVEVEPTAEAPMMKRAKTLPTQNGSAMRAVFAYLLDEDDAPPPAGPPAPAPAPKGRKKT